MATMTPIIGVSSIMFKRQDHDVVLPELLRKLTHFLEHWLAIKRSHFSRLDLAHPFLSQRGPFTLPSRLVSIQPVAKLLLFLWSQRFNRFLDFSQTHH